MLLCFVIIVNVHYVYKVTHIYQALPNYVNSIPTSWPFATCTYYYEHANMTKSALLANVCLVG